MSYRLSWDSKVKMVEIIDDTEERDEYENRKERRPS